MLHSSKPHISCSPVYLESHSAKVHWYLSLGFWLDQRGKLSTEFKCELHWRLKLGGIWNWKFDCGPLLFLILLFCYCYCNKCISDPVICVVPDTIKLTLNFFEWQEWPEGSVPYHFNHHLSFIGNRVKLHLDPQTEFI